MSLGSPVLPELPVAYFYHIPKTAGTTARSYLEQLYGEEAVCAPGLWDYLIQHSPDYLRMFRAYWGHFLGLLDAYIGVETNKITLLREPVARTVSHYLHCRRETDHPMHKRVLEQTLCEFVTEPDTRYMVENYQAMYLLKRHIDVRALYTAFEPGPEEGWFQQELESLPLTGLSEREMLATCRELLRDFWRADVSERCDDLFADLGRRFGVQLSEPERGRVRPQEQALPPIDRRTAAAIAAATRVDALLYEDLRRNPVVGIAR